MKKKQKGQATAAEKENIFYETALAKIRSKLGEENMEIIIRTFVELAEENYMLFKNISETREAAQAIQVRSSDHHHFPLRAHIRATPVTNDLDPVCECVCLNGINRCDDTHVFSKCCFHLSHILR